MHMKQHAHAHMHTHMHMHMHMHMHTCSLDVSGVQQVVFAPSHDFSEDCCFLAAFTTPNKLHPFRCTLYAQLG